MKKYKVIIIDEDPELGQCLKLIIDNHNNYEVKGTYVNFDEAKKQIKYVFPDLILMDIEYTSLDGIDALKRIKSEYPAVKIVVLSFHQEEEHIISAFKAGADGYITKESSYAEIIECLNITINEGAAMTPRIAKKIIESFHLNFNTPLSRRETQVLQHIADGYSYIKAAELLFLSKETVKTHIRNIYSKLGVTSKNEAISMARKRKFIY